MRIDKEGRNADSANKDPINLKNFIVDLGSPEVRLDIAGLFKKMVLKVRFQQTRLPFSTEQIKNILTTETLEAT